MNEYECEIYLKSPDGKHRGYEITTVKVKAENKKDALLKLYRIDLFDKLISIK